MISRTPPAEADRRAAPATAPFRYRVVDVQLKRRRMVLRDDAGCYHVARTYDRMPAIDDGFAGDQPGLGPTLIRPAQGPGLHVVFELVDCGPHVAMEQLHVTLPR